MKNEPSSVATLSNADLLVQIKRLAQCERDATAMLIASLMELDARKLYLAEGFSSLFTYCTQVLHLSEHAAYGRIEAARAARKFPVILDLLVEGAINLTTVRLLASHLTTENHAELLATGRHKSKRQIEELVARISPRPAVASTVRKLPEPKMRPAVRDEAQTVASAEPALLPAPRPAEVKPLAPELYKVQFTVNRETHEKLRRVQDLLRHKVPNGDPAVIFDRALTALVTELERTKIAATNRPQPQRPPTPGSRHIPAAIRRTVWSRDEGRCAFVGTAGRCAETGFLEFHHVVPFADGGETSVDNVQLRCRSHNAHEAQEWFGIRKAWLAREEREPFGLSNRLGPERADGQCRGS